MSGPNYAKSKIYGRLGSGKRRPIKLKKETFEERNFSGCVVFNTIILYT